MPDAGASTPSKSKASGLAKSSKSGPSAENGSDSKKRFEVKKVSYMSFIECLFNWLLIIG